MEVCKWISWSLSMIGLGISTWSATKIFHNSVTDEDVEYSSYAHLTETCGGQSQFEQDLNKKIKQTHAKELKKGFRLLVWGFALQVLGIFVSNPYFQ